MEVYSLYAGIYVRDPSPSYPILPSFLTPIPCFPSLCLLSSPFRLSRKELGAHLSCKNSTTTAGKDRVVLKENLQDIERKVCLVSVERQNCLEQV